MKQFLKDYVLNFVIALTLLFVANWMVTQSKEMYYTYMRLENFVVINSLSVSDVCLGETEQMVRLDREVYGTDIGYKATFSKELYTVPGNIQIYGYVAYPFIEKRDEEDGGKLQQIPELAAGNYQWTYYIDIDVFGVTREYFPPIKSNIFSVVDCE